ncbi:BON domain-containing protein [Shinella curvata]|uniref:BON domain-containing protein n=1 Tax=Shinella curvata TaxID=1817964 RepID=A0ABT8XJL3_9HYPH|nr:BON domain-containing protein [Shinella curvata]MCJ8056213.1 BON domain-containing protein [Shinella curvata]MDO6123924.1 BON domain-containing protein [Shinella curvata]
MVFKEATFKGKQPEHIEPPHPAWLETQVADALSVAGDVDASDVTVTCKGRRIILSGSVGSADEAERAVALASSIKDVEQVDNRLAWP